jgi:hypothetical protein
MPHDSAATWKVWISCVQYSLNSSSLDHCVCQLCPDMILGRMIEQRVNLNFCVKLQKSPSETLQMLKTVYDESTESNSNVVKWHTNVEIRD